MGFLKKLLKSKEKYTDFYKVAEERQNVLDNFIDHSLCSMLYGCKTAVNFSKALPAQDIKYIYDRTMCLLSIFDGKKSKAGSV